MSTPMTMPAHLLPVSFIAGPVEVLRGPQLKLVGDGDKTTPKTHQAFPGRQAYGLTVEVVRGFRTKNLPGREPVTAAELQSFPVTVWADTAPDCAPGDFVRLKNLCAGALDRNFYLWATAVEKIPAEKKEA